MTRDVAVVEHALLRIDVDQHEAFERALSDAVRILASATGFRAVEVLRCVEDPSMYSVEVRWRTLEDHTIGFRDSALLPRWRALIGPFLQSPPAVRHYSGVLRRAGPA